MTHPEALALMIEDKITEALVEYDDDRGMTEAEYITRALFDLFEVREEIFPVFATTPDERELHRYVLTTPWEES